jgi:hypothetical protein
VSPLEEKLSHHIETSVDLICPRKGHPRYIASTFSPLHMSERTVSARLDDGREETRPCLEYCYLLPGPPLNAARYGHKRGAVSPQQGRDACDQCTKRSKENRPREGTLAEGCTFILDQEKEHLPRVAPLVSTKTQARRRQWNQWPRQ